METKVVRCSASIKTKTKSNVFNEFNYMMSFITFIPFIHLFIQTFIFSFISIFVLYYIVGRSVGRSDYDVYIICTVCKGQFIVLMHLTCCTFI